jgi:hypothetical protein
VGFTGFQLINLATASYGFFVLLALALHVFLLDEKDLDVLLRLRQKLPSWNVKPGWLPSMALPASLQRVLSGLAVGCGVAWMAASFASGVIHFTGVERFANSFRPILSLIQPFRVANSYHLFGHITRNRIEPEFLVRTREQPDWRPLSMHYKPGTVTSPPQFATPHQPRVDFLLWFYGLAYRGQPPEYVSRLLDRLCHDPEAVASLFIEPLPDSPLVVRIEFWRYHFTTVEERGDSGAWWKRASLGSTRPVRCWGL